jgi:hypothetical protein
VAFLASVLDQSARRAALAVAFEAHAKVAMDGRTKYRKQHQFAELALNAKSAIIIAWSHFAWRNTANNACANSKQERHYPRNAHRKLETLSKHR